MDIFWLCYGNYTGKRTLKVFMRYVMASIEKNQKELAYRIYVTDSLQYIPQNRHISQRWHDVISIKKVDDRSGDEIAEDVIKQLELRFKE